MLSIDVYTLTVIRFVSTRCWPEQCAVKIP